MCDGFNVKNTVRRIKPDLFSALLSRHSLSMSVNWKASAYKYKNDVFMNYMLMEDADHRIIEPELVEIGTFAAWAGASEAIIRSLEAQGLSLPSDYMEETVLNKAVWVYLEHPELWESLARARMDIAELKGMVKMHFADRAHHTPPCATASGLQKTLHAAMGAAILSLLSAVGTLVFEIVKGMSR